jgi:hypothetical protein
LPASICKGFALKKAKSLFLFSAPLRLCVSARKNNIRFALSLFACLALTVVAQPELKPIKIDQPEWGGASAENAQAVCVSVAKTFLKHGHVAATDPILVRQGKGLWPIALTEPASEGERVIELATSGRLWSQLAYQFSHEYCHVLTKHWTAPLSHKNKWFAESLCELASIWCRDQMGDDWLAGGAPYPNWNSYGQSLKDYVTTHTKDTQTFKSPEEFTAWLKSNLDEFYKNATNRDFNKVVAAHLLPLFQKDPALWQAVPYLNGNVKRDDDFQSHLQQWYDATPSDLHPTVVKIAAEMGFAMK